MPAERGAGVRAAAVVAGAGLAAFLLALVGAVATAVAVATATTTPDLLLAAGLTVAAVVSALTVRVLLRRRPARRRVIASTATALVVAAVAVLLALPLPDARRPEPAVPGTRYWALPGGSRLAYVHIPGQGQHRSAPVVVLHGGPGIPDLPGLTRFFRPVAALGYDVYVYDQLGAGRSSRLTDPRGYGIARDVADLEQVRRAIGADRMVLVGHSYGGTLAAHYLAAHPARVASMVLSSPGPLDPSDPSGSRATARLPLDRRLATWATALQPRALLGYALLQVSPAAAHAYLGDAEADARDDTILHLADPSLHCTRGQWQPPTPGSGFYALQYPQSATAPPLPDVRAALSGNPTPVLVLKGRCDYQTWRSAVDYEQVLPQTTLLYLRGAGHSTYQDEPGIVLAAVRGFLTGGPLPLAPYPGERQPPDYQR